MRIGRRYSVREAKEKSGNRQDTRAHHKTTTTEVKKPTTRELSALKVKFEDLSAENETLSSNIDELQREMTDLRQRFQVYK